MKKNKNANILFIDDDDDFRDAISIILTSEGFKVVALNGSQKLDKSLEENHFDIAIVDYFLPMESGIEIVQRILTNQKTKNIKILMISSHENIKTLIIQNGIKHFMPKPLDPEELITKVRAIL